MKNKYMITLRNLTRNKLFSTINIVGLSIGMAAALLLLLWIRNEVSYDRFYPKADYLYKVMNRIEQKGEIGVNSGVFSNPETDLKEDYPEIKSLSRMRQRWDLLTYGENSVGVLGRFVDPDFLTMFEFPFVSGNAEAAMPNPGSIVISQDKATILFGAEDPMGKVVLLNNDEPYTVTGVVKNLPINTQFRFDFLIPWTEVARNGQKWGGPIEVFVELRENASQEEVETKMKDFYTRRNIGSDEVTLEPFLHSVKKWHLYGNFVNGKNVGSGIETVRIIILLTVLILLIACINFTTMSVARSENRSKEVGMRKIAGSGKGLLVMQFIGEAVVVSFIAGILAIVLAHLSLPWFNGLMNAKLFMPYATTWFWLGILSLVFLTGVLAGSYPAFILSSLPPLQTIKKTSKRSNNPISFRKALIVFQFCISLMLIVYTMVVYKQLNHAQNRDLGYTKDNVVYYNMRGNLNDPSTYTVFRDEMLNTGVVQDICLANMPFTHAWETYSVSWPEKDPELNITAVGFSTNGKLATLVDIPFIEGRDFDFETYASDKDACIINEALLKLTGYTDPLNKSITLFKKDFRIIGVIKDFVLESPYNPVRPLIMLPPFTNNLRVMDIRYKPGTNMADNLKISEPIFNKFNSPFSFEFITVEEQHVKKFANEKSIGQLASSSAIIAIILSCLGLFALAAYTAEKRTKEIAVRKVNGSTIFEIVVLLIRDFLYLVGIAAVIAIPIVWYISRQWLDKYAYRTSLDWWIFAGAVLLIAVIAILSVGGQAYRAAKANPVDSLNKE